MRVDEHTINLDETPVYYRSAEWSGMPTLYLHGIPTSSDDWVEFLARTGGIAPDLTGFGRSGKGGHLDYSLSGLAGFVERLLGHLGVQEVLLVGHDWGAAVGLTFAERNPGRVHRLVLCNPAPVSNSSQWPRVLQLLRRPGVGELLMGATTKALLARTLRRGSVRPDAWTAARIDAVWDQFDQGTQRAVLRLVRSARETTLGSGGPRPPVGSPPVGSPPVGSPPVGSPPVGFPPVESPPAGSAHTTGAMVVWGESDPWYPPAVADAYAAHLPGATVERITGAGHWPWLDQPEVVNHVASVLEG